MLAMTAWERCGRGVCTCVWVCVRVHLCLCVCVHVCISLCMCMCICISHLHGCVVCVRGCLSAPGLQETYGFLYLEYGPSAWWWEVEELVRKLLLSSLVVLIDSGSPLQVQCPSYDGSAVAPVALLMAAVSPRSHECSSVCVRAWGPVHLSPTR